MSWPTILVLAAGTYLFKVGGVILGRLSLRGADGAVAMEGGADGSAGRPGVATRIGQLLPPALLSALVVSQTVTTGTELTVDARLVGVGAGAVAVALRAPFWLVVILAAAVTAGVRLVAG